MRYVAIYLVLVASFVISIVTNASHKNNGTYSKSKTSLGGNSKRKVLILDVDNCLYSESEIKAAAGEGIEQQIIDRTHAFGEKELNLSKHECDEMYLSHGSTVEGIRQKLESEGEPAERVAQVLRQYYHYVYDGIDMTCLLPATELSLVNTGYNHAMSRTRRKVIRDILHNMPYPMYFASNSPKNHVLKVLSALGLKDICYEQLLTPDTVGGEGKLDFPTKFHPKQFFQTLLEEYEADELVLVDDSTNNLNKAKEIGMRGLQVNNGSSLNLEEALAVFTGHVESNLLSNQKAAYEFSDVKYLQSKNEVDKIAINAEVWKQVLANLSRVSENTQLVRIVDVGAGLLSMLELVLFGGGEKQSMVKHIQQGTELEYIAYESNVQLIEACLAKLKGLGFQGGGGGDESDEFVFKKSVKKNDVEVKVILRVKDFAENRLEKKERPHLIIGCCFADLFEPNELIAAIARFANYYSFGGGIESDKHDDILVYFPITFSGTTQFLPPKPFEVNGEAIIPSDTMAFQLYADSLISHHGHNLDPSKIVEAMRNIGAPLILSSASVWHIDYTKNRYLWDTMMYFFGNSVGPQVNHQWDTLGWMNRARKGRPIIRVTNQDLLFTLPATDIEGQNSSNKLFSNEKKSETTCGAVEEIEFRSPHQVGTKVKKLTQLGPRQVEVKSICSLISSGTELKIFKGLFDEAALDINIKGMADESMKYPLSYGYSLVGVVTRCGDEVEDSEVLLGRLVFTFSPHATHSIVDRDGIQLVPDGISAEDAIFMPSVETALSIVHDANVRVGEKVAVYGQGLIGLLVNAILSSQQTPANSGQYGIVTVFDTVSDRLAMASVMGASQALLPMDAPNAGPYDVSIEVSGNFRALQSAIDFTQNGGRVIVGSWYGNSDINLKLGIDFHRSHKTIKTSQVSNIPAELSTLWSKDRRFSLTWELVRSLCPSRLITKSVTLDKAQEAFESLDRGEEIAISFKYP